MPASPSLVLVDPRARHRAHLRQRLLSIALGVLVAGASAIPFVLSLGR
jgi:hypothetical protein